MGFFDTQEGVDQYTKMVESYDGRELVQAFRAHVPSGSSVLELGMGPGKDLTLLAGHYQVTGSDSSTVFIERFSAQDPSADLLVLDAVTLETERRFDAIFSNKVLQHLTKEEAGRSLAAQHRVLKADGIAFHSLWHGDKLDQHHGLLFQHYTEQTFSELLEGQFELTDSKVYAEDASDDSLWVVLKRLP